MERKWEVWSAINFHIDTRGNSQHLRPGASIRFYQKKACARSSSYRCHVRGLRRVSINAQRRRTWKKLLSFLSATRHTYETRQLTYSFDPLPKKIKQEKKSISRSRVRWANARSVLKVLPSSSVRKKSSKLQTTKKLITAKKRKTTSHIKSTQMQLSVGWKKSLPWKCRVIRCKKSSSSSYESREHGFRWSVR